MNVTVAEIMHTPVITIARHETAAHARKLMREHGISALPVVGSDHEALGMVTASDLLDEHPDGAPMSSFMSAPALTVPSSEGPHVAARIMRNHKLHHVVVVDAHQVVGIVSAYDLLELVEEHRFQMKQAPTPSSRKTPKRQ